MKSIPDRRSAITSRNASGYFDYFNGTGARDGPAGEPRKGLLQLQRRNPAPDRAQLELREGALQRRTRRSAGRWGRPLGEPKPAARSPTRTTSAFSSGHDGNNTFTQALWTALYEGGVDVALTGHSHNYERFAPMNAAGKRDRTLGVREFVVGTGGAFFTGMSSPKPNSEVRQNNTFGVLKITLRPTKYTWKFTPRPERASPTQAPPTARPPAGIPPAPPPEPPAVTDPFPAVNPKTGAPNGRHAVKCTITGTGGNDVLRGTRRKDYICGLGGNDRIRGLGGNDVILGGPGNDWIVGGRGNDRLSGNAGRDLLRGQAGADRLVGGSGHDRLDGGSGSDRLSALDGKRGIGSSGGRGRDPRVGRPRRQDPADRATAAPLARPKSQASDPAFLREPAPKMGKRPRALSRRLPASH